MTTKRDYSDVRRRMLALAAALFAGEQLSTEVIRARFQVSKATAKRDLVVIEQCLPVSFETTRDGARLALLQPK